MREQILSRGVSDRGVLQAMREVPRHLFVSGSRKSEAYRDYPLPIGRGQTISQPYIVAYMTEKLGLEGNERALEVGTGSGYQTAILSRLAAEVITLEVVSSLSKRAQDILGGLGYDNIRFYTGDGYYGRQEEAPFDAIIVTAAAPEVPEPLVKQLKPGGVMVIPIGKSSDIQELLRLRKGESGVTVGHLIDVRFVPLTHRLR